MRLLYQIAGAVAIVETEYPCVFIRVPPCLKAPTVILKQMNHHKERIAESGMEDICGIVLFGSCARNQIRVGGDIDLLVLTDHGGSQELRGGLASDLAEICLVEDARECIRITEDYTELLQKFLLLFFGGLLHDIFVCLICNWDSSFRYLIRCFVGIKHSSFLRIKQFKDQWIISCQSVGE